MAYEKQTWTAGDAITKQRMDHIEDGIYDASLGEDKVNKSAVANRLDVNTEGYVLDARQGQVLSGRIADALTAAQQAQGMASAAQQGNQAGTDAKTQIVAATTGATPNYESLAARFDAIDKTFGIKIVEGEPVSIYGPSRSVASVVELINSNAETILREVENARTNNTTHNTYESLSAHLDTINSSIATLRGNVADINAAAGTGHTLVERINQLQLLQDEVDAAHREVAEGAPADTLVARFTAIEQAASDLAATVSALDTDVVKKADVKDNFSSNDTNLPLSALKGKELRQMIGGNFDATNTVAKAIIDAQNTAQTNAIDHADDNKVDKANIYNDLDYVPAQDATDDKVLDARQGKALKDLIDSMDTAYKAADTTLGGRISDVEDAIDTLNGNASTEGSVLNTVNTQIAAVVAEAPEAFDTLKEIADWIDDHDADALEMQQDISDNADAITALQNTVGDENSGLVATANTALAKANAAAVKTEVDSSLSGLNTRLNAVDGGEALTGAKTLATRVSEAESAITNLQNEPKSATEVISVEQFEALEANEANSHKDYLVGPDSDNLYKYYHIIETSDNVYTKVLISGGGSGSGNTTGLDLSAAEFDALTLDDVSENTDYYVTRDDGVHHYRYVSIEDAESGESILTKVEIGQFVDINKIKRYNIATAAGTQVDENGNEEAVTYLNFYQYDYNEDNTQIDTSKTPFKQIVLPQGGGTSSAQVNKLIRFGDQTVQKIVGSQILLRGFYSSWDADGIQSTAGTATLRTGNTVIQSNYTLASGAKDAVLGNWTIIDNPVFENNVPVISNPDTNKVYIINQDNTYSTWTYDGSAWNSSEGAPTGFYVFDVTDYCSVGTTQFNLSVQVNNDTLGTSWTINIIDLHLESDAPEVLLINAAEAYNFPYTAFGALTKTLHVIIDNDTEHKITQSLSSVTSGRAAYVAIPAQAHGAHKIEMYLTATVGGSIQTTDSIIREYIWYDVNNTDEPLILASPKNGQTITAQQYATIEIPYQVYKKGTNSIVVDYYADDTLFGSVTLNDTNTGTLSYLASDTGAHTLKIMVDNDSETALIINLNITELDINIAPVAGAIIDFDPTMLTNSSTNRLPSWTVGANTYSLTASDNFNWSEDTSGGGYKVDTDGKAFVIKAGSYVDLNYPMFARKDNNNILTTGAEMKIIFKVGAVRDVNAVWYQNIGTLTEKTVGIQLGAHSGWLKTDKATDTTTATTNSEYPKWVSGTTYALNDITIYKDTIYKCIKLCEDHTDVVPGTTAGDTYWKVLTGDNIPADTSEIKAWATGTEYAKDTIVSYNTAYYKCAKAIINEITTNPKTASDNWLSMGKIETEILATNSYLYMPYSEEDKIELDININKYNANTDTNFIMSYEDGVPSKAYAYEYGAAGDGLYHNNTIRIGSNDCDVYIYRLRIYDKSLTTADILQNFIADGNGISEKVERYNRNCIYWDSTQEKYFTSPSATAVLDPIKLAEVMPDVKVLMLDTPVFTVGKKNFVQGSSLRCIHADGGNVYKSRGDADNWLFTNGFHSGQGTTSDNYGQSARNVDFLFEVDGVNYPTKKKNMGTYKPSTDYVSKVYIGKNASSWNGTTWEPAREPTDNEICDNWKGDKCKVSLTESSVPNNYFNLKVNVASSENVNNALFQKRYDDFLVYDAPTQTAQIAKHRAAYSALGLNPNKIKVKNSMEFVPAVLFVRENEPDLTKHIEFTDTNWHFYALGNIGDSKKTDYTRAYDPDDMNEFTCENSDNNTNNGQFQSGVFMYQNVRAIETPYEAFDSEKTYKANDIVVNNGNIQIYDGTSWSNATLTNWTDSETPYFAPYTAPNTMQYLFPVTPSEWNVQVNGEYVNYKHYTLVNEEFDGDHSFEFRYACRGDYRDGDLINVTEDQDDDAQFDLNHNVVLAFYEWLVTATEKQYAAEAPQWFVKSAMEFFYAYTHYYTMMDNRAKNTFWHFAKTGTYIEVSRPVKELLHVYEESTDGGSTWVKATGTEIDPDKKYRTQYAFDLWAYDMDTALGIDNNGALVFPYGKEDGDYRTEGDPASGYAFNGAGSIFWRRLKNTFSGDLADIMNQAKDCFKSEDLINEFDTYQNCYPEEIWRLDIERKYIRTFTGITQALSYDNSVAAGKQNPRFLTSMMQGRKKYQRRQWIRNQGVYFNSKYRLTDIIDNSNTIEFNCTTPADIENIAVTPSYYLQLVPYQDMYLNVQVGNGNYQDSYITADGSKNLRAKAGQTYTFALGISGKLSVQETRIYINGANYLSAIGNLAPMYPYSFDLRALAHIKTLNIGTDVSEYTNTKFTELKLPTFMPLLESLNIKNCHSVAGTITLSTANNIRTVEATGTAISGISLPDYTNIEILHIPSTVTALNLYGARFLTDFKVYNSAGVNNYSTLYKLHIYDSDYSSEVDWIDIASAILSKQSLQTELSLLKLSTATIGDIQELEPFNEFKSTLENNGGILELGGTIHITGAWSEIERDNYMSVWPQLIFDTSAGTKQTKHKVTYKYDAYEDNDGNIVNGDIIKELYINDGATAPDIYSDGTLSEMPHRDPTVRVSYEFGSIDALSDAYIPYSGWQLSGSTTSLYEAGGAPIIRQDTVIETHFETVSRAYYVKWFMNEDPASLVKTSTAPVAYGEGYDLEAPTVAEIHEAGQTTCTININNGQATYSIFNGWEKLPTNITPSANDETYNIYATYDTDTVIIDDLFNANNLDNLTPVQLLVLSALDSTGKSTYGIDSKIAVGKRVTYTMGQDSIATGTTLVSGNPLRLDGAIDASYATNIQPLKAGNDAFTLAIDYCFNPNATYSSNASFATLASVYYGSTTEGIRNGLSLFYGLNSSIYGLRVGWGDMYSQAGQSKIVGNTTNMGQRNIVVLRHPKGSNTLYIYSGLNGNINTPENVEVQTLDWSNYNSDAYLNFGRLTSGTTDSTDDIPNTVVNGKGTIFWAKYWPEDLGIGECKRLAAWPHETITYAISQLKSSSTSTIRVSSTTAVSPSIYLSALTASSHIKIAQTKVQGITNFSARDYSVARTLCNKRVFAGLPTNIQAIMCQPNISYTQVNYAADQNSGNISYTLNENNSLIGKDYVFQYSAGNLTNKVSTYIQREDGNFPWLNNNVVAYTYSSSSGWTQNSNDSNSYYMNIRTPFKALTWSGSNKMRVFREYNTQIPSNVQIASSIANTGEIRSGDIYIDTYNQAYIYVLNSEIQALGIQIMPTTGDYAKFNTSNLSNTSLRGGWVRAEDYWTRSVIAGSNAENFAYVNEYGEVETTTTNSANSAGLNVMYTFAI